MTPFERRLHRRYALYTAGVALFVLALAALERGGWPRAWIAASFLAGTVGVYAVIGLACRTTDEAEYMVAGRRVPALYNGLATASDWMSAASFIGTAGVLYAEGHGGLAYIVGWTGGFCLVATLLAPALRASGCVTIPDFIGARYGGRWPRLLAAAGATMVSFVYVVVQVHGVGLITSHLTGFGFEIGIFVGLGGVLVCSFLGGMRAVTWTQVAQYIVLIVAYMVPVLWLSHQQHGGWASPLDYRQQLERIGERERELLRDPAEIEVRGLWAERVRALDAKLADVPAAMRDDAAELAARIERWRRQDVALAQVQRAERALERMPKAVDDARDAYLRERAVALRQSQPLAGMAPLADASGRASERANFVALALCLMMGTAAMPHVLTRWFTTPSVAAARRSVGWALLFIGLLYASAPALAVMVKAQVFDQLVGLPIDELPAWMRRWMRLDAGLLSVEDVNLDGRLQLGELRLDGELIVLAAPEMGGMPLVVTFLVAAGGLAAALSTADGLLLTISNTISHDVAYRLVNPRLSAVKRVMLSKLVVLVAATAAAWVASLKVAAILPFITAAFSIAAATFFPVLVAAVFWRGANAPGAVAAMVVGAASTLGYMAAKSLGARRWLPLDGWVDPAPWFGIDPTAAGIFGVPAAALALVAVSMLARGRVDPAGQALVDRMRAPAAPR